MLLGLPTGKPRVAPPAAQRDCPLRASPGLDWPGLAWPGCRRAETNNLAFLGPGGRLRLDRRVDEGSRGSARVSQTSQRPALLGASLAAGPTVVRRYFVAQQRPQAPSLEVARCSPRGFPGPPGPTGGQQRPSRGPADAQRPGSMCRCSLSVECGRRAGGLRYCLRRGGPALEVQSVPGAGTAAPPGLQAQPSSVLKKVTRSALPHDDSEASRARRVAAPDRAGDPVNRGFPCGSASGGWHHPCLGRTYVRRGSSRAGLRTPPSPLPDAERPPNS